VKAKSAASPPVDARLNPSAAARAPLAGWRRRGVVRDVPVGVGAACTDPGAGLRTANAANRSADRCSGLVDVGRGVEVVAVFGAVAPDRRRASAARRSALAVSAPSDRGGGNSFMASANQGEISAG